MVVIFAIQASNGDPLQGQAPKLTLTYQSSLKSYQGQTLQLREKERKREREKERKREREKERKREREKERKREREKERKREREKERAVCMKFKYKSASIGR